MGVVLSTPKKNMKNKTINERLITITGKACITGDLELGQEVNLRVNGGVVSIEDRDNNDGTFDRIIRVKIIATENL